MFESANTAPAFGQIKMSMNIIKRKLKEQGISKISYMEDTSSLSWAIKRAMPLSPSQISSAIKYTQAKGSSIPYSYMLDDITESGVFFDFGTIEHNSMHKDVVRTHQLYNEGILNLPFDKCIFRYTREFDDHREKEENLIYLRKVDDGIEIMTFCKIKVDKLSWANSGIPIKIYREQVVLREGKSAFEYDVLFSDKERLMELYTQEGFNNLIKHTSEDLFTPLMILNTRYIPNLQSTKSGLFNESKRSAELGNQCITVDGKLYSELSKKGKGKRGKKQPHIRRGHIRNLSSGQRVWVRDCVINMPVANGVLDNAKRYSVLSNKRSVLSTNENTLSANLLKRIKKFIPPVFLRN